MDWTNGFSMLNVFTNKDILSYNGRIGIERHALEIYITIIFFDNIYAIRNKSFLCNANGKLVWKLLKRENISL